MKAHGDSGPRGTANGMTLFEVLVAILILSFGMLGMLGLLLSALKLTSTSNYRNIATLESQAMADLLRSNVRNLTSYDAPTDASDANCYTASGCSSTTTRIQTEYSLWLARLATMLPSGTGIVCRDSTPTDGTPANWACTSTAGNPFVVKVCWDESRVPSSSAVTCIQTLM